LYATLREVSNPHIHKARTQRTLSHLAPYTLLNNSQSRVIFYRLYTFHSTAKPPSTVFPARNCRIASSITQGFAALRAPYMQWANLARLAVQGLPYDVQRLAELETYINARRAELRKVVLVASEHLTEEQLEQLRNRAKMSKYAWRSLKKKRPVTVRHGFTLVSY